MNPDLAAAIQRLHPVARAWLARQLQAMMAQNGGYGMPYANNSPYTAHDEQGLNWHGHAGFMHGQPMGGYGRQPSPTVNPMKRPTGGYGNGW